MMINRNPIDILRKEHEKVLNILNKLEENLENKDLIKLGENITLLENEFDKHSLNKEEKAFFPEFEKFMPRDGGPTGMMIIEHKDLVESIRVFKENLQIDNLQKLDEIGSHILFLLRQHIDKENNIIFTMADMHLNANQKNLILEKFAVFDSENKK